MKRILKEYLPDRISDEAAYHLTHFFVTLAVDVGEHYLQQMLRHRRLMQEHKDELPDPPF